MTRDPYAVLGLAPGSSPAEWKRAYRRLAMRWHPDRNEQPEATERFKEIGAAYERLLNQEFEAVEEDDSGAATDNEAAQSASEPRRASDIRLELELSIEEAVTGCRKTVHYRRGKACQTCAGSGEAGLSKTRFCGACHGSGRVRDAARHLIQCGACQGRGFFQERICPDCAGSGRDESELSLEIAVPPGVLTGDELRLAGQGEIGDGDRADGHLFLSIRLLPHPLYQLLGRDLCYRMPVSLLACLAGAEIDLPTPQGPRRHRLTPGLPGAEGLRLKGLGLPRRGDKPAGDLCVTLEALVPDGLSVRQRKCLQQAEDEVNERLVEQLPALAEWRARYLSQEEAGKTP